MPYVASKKKTKVERKPSTRSAKSATVVEEEVAAATPSPAHENGVVENGNGIETTTKKSKPSDSTTTTTNGSQSSSSSQTRQTNGRHKTATANGTSTSQLNVTANNITAINEESMSTSDLSTGTNTTVNNLTVNLTTASVATTASSRALFLADPIPVIVRSNRAGPVLAVGENLSNQLGLGSDVDNRKKPQLVKELPENVVQVAAGGMHSACLTLDGLVYTFGCNDEFALGRDEDEEIDQVELPEKCVEVTAGDSHTAALSESGCVYAWGTFRDGSGVIGLNRKSSGGTAPQQREKIEKIAKRPVKIELRDKVVRISSGADHLVILTQHGEVYTAGNSEHGQLGRVSKYNCERGGRRGCDMLLEPALVRFGLKRELKGHRQIEDVFTTPYCTFLKVRDSDIIIGFGLNNSHQLGAPGGENRYQPEILSSVKFANGARLKKACGGMHHTLLLDTKGRVYALGSHRYGSLGLGKIEADVPEPQLIPSLNDIVEIAANTNVSYAIDSRGKVFSWGTNYSKQLGQDTEDDYFDPTPLQSRHMDIRDTYAVSVGGQHALFVVGEEKPQKMED